MPCWRCTDSLLSPIPIMKRGHDLVRIAAQISMKKKTNPLVSLAERVTGSHMAPCTSAETDGPHFFQRTFEIGVASFHKLGLHVH